MVWDPPKQKVNVTRMIIYSFIPILGIYAAWRIQKFWLLVILGLAVSVGLGITLAPLSLASPELSYVVSVIGSIIINILIVKYFAEKYNETIKENN
jgi:membrane protein implicated in regulation of membrane protease activity